MAAPHDLCQLPDVKGFFPTALGSADDALLMGLISSTSFWISRTLNRTLYARGYVERRNGNGQTRMRVMNLPLISVSELRMDDTVLTPVPPGASQSGSGYTWDDQFIYLRESDYYPLVPSVFTRGVQNVQITYTAGYNTPGQVEQASYPGWSPVTAYALNTFVNPGNGYVYLASSISGTGTSDSVAPAWPTGVGQTIIDNAGPNQIVWKCYAPYVAPVSSADALPADLSAACVEQVVYLYKRRTRIGDKGYGVGPDHVDYFMDEMHATVKAVLSNYREVVPVYT
jgi:hypothetical protein